MTDNAESLSDALARLRRPRPPKNRTPATPKQALHLLRCEIRRATPGEWRTAPRGVQVDGVVAGFNKDGTLSKRHSGKNLPIYWDSTGRQRRFWEDARAIVAMRNTFDVLLDIAGAAVDGDMAGVKKAAAHLSLIRVVEELAAEAAGGIQS